MARVYSDLLNAQEYGAILQEIVAERGIKPRSAQRAIQRHASGKGTLSFEAASNYAIAESMDGREFPGVFAAEESDEEPQKQFEAGTAWNIRDMIEAMIEADRVYVETALDRGRIKGEYGFVTGIVRVSVTRLLTGDTGETYDPTTGDFSEFTVKRGQEGYQLDIHTHTEYL